jgi:hypothetical protein
VDPVPNPLLFFWTCRESNPGLRRTYSKDETNLHVPIAKKFNGDDITGFLSSNHQHFNITS